MSDIQPLTLQQVFDNALNGVRGQGYKPSMSVDGCAYRGFGGRKCAIGHCIPDELYDPSMDAYPTGVAVLREKFPPVDALFSGLSTHDLGRLQGIHDDLSNTAGSLAQQQFEREMQRFAEERGLTYTAPQPAAA